jgi:hypothetical protein
VDLEAGGGFAAAVLVYLPGMFLTIALAEVILVALFPRPASAIVLIAARRWSLRSPSACPVQDSVFSRYLTD